MEILTRLNWVDVLILIIMIRISYVSFQDGLSHVIFPLLSGIIMIIVALRYYMVISDYIGRYLPKWPMEILNFLSFAALIMGSGLILKFARILLDKVIAVTWHPLIEKFGGLVLGIIRASVVTSIILVVIALLPIRYFQYSIRDRSLAGMYFLKIGPGIYERLSGFLPVIKIGGSPAKSGDLIEYIVSDKLIFPSPKKEKDPTPEWEKVKY